MPTSERMLNLKMKLNYMLIELIVWLRCPWIRSGSGSWWLIRNFYLFVYKEWVFAVYLASSSKSFLHFCSSYNCNNDEIVPIANSDFGSRPSFGQTLSVRRSLLFIHFITGASWESCCWTAEGHLNQQDWPCWLVIRLAAVSAKGSVKE